MLHVLNELVVRGKRYLLVCVSSSHIARLAEGDEPGRPALAEGRTGTEPWATRYDLGALLDPIWNHRTLCGREWIEMEPGEGPPFDGWGTGVYAPHCRNCLRILSSGLESIAPDERIPLIVATLSWVHWFNEDRLHGHCADVPPAEFEAAFYAAQQAAPTGVGNQ